MTLKARLQQSAILEAPGIYDVLTALLAEKAGFEAVFVSGSAVAFSQLGRPDIGLVTQPEMAQVVDRIRDRVNIHLFVDADSGFGNDHNVARTIRMFERAGASGIQIEDQLNTKAMDQVGKRPLVSTETMVSKIKAATDARKSENLVISARTDAAFTEGVDAALDRLSAYVAAGADMVFLEGLTEQADMERLCAQFAGQVPILFNQLKPHAEDALTADQLQILGYSVVLYPSAAINSATLAVGEAFQALKPDAPMPELPVSKLVSG